jgi:hypothetical protein
VLRGKAVANATAQQFPQFNGEIKMKTRIALRCALAASVFACAALAQTEQGFILVTTFKVKPDMRQEFLDMQKNEITPAYKKAGVTNYQFWSSALVGDLNEYMTATFVPNAATFDSPSPIVKALGPEGAERLFTKLRKCTLSTTRILAHPRGDLSIDAEMTAPPKLMVLTMVTVKAGMAADFERWMKTEFVPGLKKGGQKMYLVSSVAFGGPILTYASVQFVDSFAALDKPSALVAGLGREGADKVMSHSTMVDHVQRTIHQLMPELSIFGPAGTN